MADWVLVLVCVFVLVRVEVVHCARLSPFHISYGGIVFVCLPAALVTFLKKYKLITVLVPYICNI